MEIGFASDSVVWPLLDLRELAHQSGVRADLIVHPEVWNLGGPDPLSPGTQDIPLSARVADVKVGLNENELRGPQLTWGVTGQGHSEVHQGVVLVADLALVGGMQLVSIYRDVIGALERFDLTKIVCR